MSGEDIRKLLGGYATGTLSADEQKALFEQWVLTAQFHDYPNAWRKVFAEAGYTGDYYWTIVE